MSNCFDYVKPEEIFRFCKELKVGKKFEFYGELKVYSKIKFYKNIVRKYEKVF